MLQYSYHTYISTCINVSRIHTHDMGIRPIPVYIRNPATPHSRRSKPLQRCRPLSDQAFSSNYFRYMFDGVTAIMFL